MPMKIVEFQRARHHTTNYSSKTFAEMKLRLKKNYSFGCVSFAHWKRKVRQLYETSIGLKI